jgi:predicted nuclease of predicted toxin-antitoxin system
VADENVDHPVVLALRAGGHEVWSVAEQEPGLRDDDVLERARSDAAVLITADKDFGELVFRLGLVPDGVLLLRLAGLPPGKKAELVTRVLEQHASELVGAFAVLSPASLRIRELPGSGADAGH